MRDTVKALMYWEQAFKAAVESPAATCEIKIPDDREDLVIPIWQVVPRSSLWVVGPKSC